MQAIFLALTAFGSLIALGNWRYGIFAMIVVGVLQDPLRKLAPGMPSYFLLGAAVVFMAVAFSAFATRSLSNINSLYLGDRNLRTAWTVLAMIIVLQAVVALRWGNPLIPVLGLLTYFAPVVALVVGQANADSERAIRRFLLGYVIIVVPACMTVYLSANSGELYPVLRDIGTATGRELIIYDIGTALRSHPGIFRVGEIAAWHAATAIIFILILITGNRSILVRLVAAVVILLLIGAIILTGRRKMLMALTIFVVSQWALLGMFLRGKKAPAITVLVVGFFGSLILTLLDPASMEAVYLERGKSVYGSAGDRLVTAYNLFLSAVNRSSGIGLGAGVAAQGVRFAGGGTAAVVGGAGEAGIGKIVLELGIPGALAVVWLLVALARRLYESLHILGRTSDRVLFYSVSFISLLIANAATFMVATQLYGDFFIMIILGFVFGVVFSLIHFGLRINMAQKLR